MHLCAQNGIVVLEYKDHPTGILEARKVDGGSFKTISLNPQVEVSPNCDVEKARELHLLAHKSCYLAKSCSVPINIKPVIKSA
ncbi:MAG: hypothetical protein C4K58_02975 [Flavobacteriaceae bacterium]|nr:MAG: hypothetical protein C4K58_02975 [Flavobacteriaceae bacterium]